MPGRRCVVYALNYTSLCLDLYCKHSLFTIPRTINLKTLQLILQLCLLLMPAIETTCCTLRVAICSINRSFRCMFDLLKIKTTAIILIPVRVALIDQ